MPDQPPRLHHVFQRYEPPLYFVTFNTHKRRRLLANVLVHNELVRFAQEGHRRGIGIGRYVIMPDHVHLFVRGNLDFSLRTMGPNPETSLIESNFASATALAARV